MRRFRYCVCALCVSAMTFIGPVMLTVSKVPHPDHPGHVHGVS